MLDNLLLAAVSAMFFHLSTSRSYRRLRSLSCFCKDLQKFCRLYYDTARSYKALLKFQLTAEDLGVKTDYWTHPEDDRSDKNKCKIKYTLTVSGKVVSKAVLTPKKKKDSTDDGTDKS